MKAPAMMPSPSTKTTGLGGHAPFTSERENELYISTQPQVFWYFNGKKKMNTNTI